jgi:hypothetical protein
MEPPSSKLQHQRVEETTEHKQTAQQQAGREFASVDEMIRYDALQNPPPAELANRVAETVASLPKPARSWWQKWFSGE